MAVDFEIAQGASPADEVQVEPSIQVQLPTECPEEPCLFVIVPIALR